MTLLSTYQFNFYVNTPGLYDMKFSIFYKLTLRLFGSIFELHDTIIQYAFMH